MQRLAASETPKRAYIVSITVQPMQEVAEVNGLETLWSRAVEVSAQLISTALQERSTEISARTRCRYMCSGSGQLDSAWLAGCLSPTW